MPGEMPAARDEDHPFLTSSDVTQLTAAVRGLAMQLVQASQLHNKLIVAIRDLTVALDGKITRTTQEMLPMVPAVVLEDPTKG